jgi:hypothetical protein
MFLSCYFPDVLLVRGLWNAYGYFGILAESVGVSFFFSGLGRRFGGRCCAQFTGYGFALDGA